MIKVNELNEKTVAKASTEENGLLTAQLFNSYMKLAELDIMDWLTGDGKQAPAPILTQKRMDWLRPFIVRSSKNFKNVLPVPADYYGYKAARSVSLTGNKKFIARVDLLNSDAVADIVGSAIEGLKPSLANVKAEIIGKEFQLYPEQMEGQIDLVYYRYPKFGVFGVKNDPVYNSEVYDAATSTDLEWDEALIPYFVWRINFYYNERNREGNQNNTPI